MRGRSHRHPVPAALAAALAHDRKGCCGWTCEEHVNLLDTYPLWTQKGSGPRPKHPLKLTCFKIRPRNPAHSVRALSIHTLCTVTPHAPHSPQPVTPILTRGAGLPQRQSSTMVSTSPDCDHSHDLHIASGSAGQLLHCILLYDGLSPLPLLFGFSKAYNNEAI